MLSAIAERVTKIGGGHPSKEAIRLLLERYDADPSGWYPGKSDQAKFGPSPVLNGAKRRCVAIAAMAMKQEGMEPTYKTVVARCPNATLNPHTGHPASKHRVYDVLSEDCYDNDPELPWSHQARLQKTALSQTVMDARLATANHFLGLRHTARWYYDNLMWVDVCNSILPLTARKAAEQALARKGGKGWVSDDAKQWSQNLQGNKSTVKQNSWDTMRVYFVPVLVRGKLHVESLPEGFPGDTPEGVETLVGKLPGILARRFPNETAPKYVMTDRGKGFFHSSTGKITPEYKAALEKAGLKPFQGENAKAQSGTFGDLLLHETAMAWLRKLLERSEPAEAWKETREEFYARLKEQCQHVNKEYDVEGLCKEFPERLKLLQEKKGDRLKK